MEVGHRPGMTADATAAQACELGAAQMLLAGQPIKAVQILASRNTHAALSAALRLCAIILANEKVRRFDDLSQWLAQAIASMSL